jgi:antitoxin component YwqK of YwqJK toxin-antitoxin module
MTGITMQRIDSNLLFRDDDQIYRYQGKPFTGVAYELRQDGTLWGEQTFARGVLDGASRSWYPNQQLQHETNYKLAWAHGWKKEWYPDGKTKSAKLFELGVCVERKCWDGAGALIEDYKIDPASNDFATLEQKRRAENQRVRLFEQRYSDSKN